MRSAGGLVRRWLRAGHHDRRRQPYRAVFVAGSRSQARARPAEQLARARVEGRI